MHESFRCHTYTHTHRFQHQQSKAKTVTAFGYSLLIRILFWTCLSKKMKNSSLATYCGSLDLRVC